MTTYHLLQQKLNSLLGIEARLIDVLPDVTKFVENQRLQHLLEYHVSQTRYRHDQLITLTIVDLEVVPCAPIHSVIVDLRHVIEAQPERTSGEPLLANKLRLLKGYQAAAYSQARWYALTLGYTRLSAFLETAWWQEKTMETALANLVTASVAAHSNEVHQTL